MVVMGSVMWQVAGVALQATPSPDPSAPPLQPGIAPTDVSPGLLGFLATFALVAMVIPLVLSMNKHLRRVKFEEATQAGQPPTDPFAEDTSAAEPGTTSSDGPETDDETPPPGPDPR